MNQTFNETILDLPHVHASSSQDYFQQLLPYVIALPICCLAIIANSVVLVILLRKKPQQRTPFDIIITSLAVADLLTSISCTIYVGYRIALAFLPSEERLRHQSRSDTINNVALIFFFLSLLHVLVITFLRFCAIFWPLKFRQFATKALSKVLIAITWTMSVIAVFIFTKHGDSSYTTGMIIFASGGLVCCAYIIIAMKICLLVKKKQFAWNKEHRVLLNSFGVTLTFFACLLPYAFRETRLELSKNINEKLAGLLFSVNFLADPLFYFYFSYWLSKRDEQRRMNSRSEAVTDQRVHQNEENYA